MNTINPTTFEELRQISGDEILDELIQAFLDEAPVMVSDLHAAFESGDVETFRRNAHSLKSNALTFGAEELAAVARELESLAREHRLAEVGDNLEKLAALSQSAQTELKSMMK